MKAIGFGILTFFVIMFLFGILEAILTGGTGTSDKRLGGYGLTSLFIALAVTLITWGI